MKIRFENEVYDLECRELRRALHEEVDNYVYELDAELFDEYQDDLGEIHELISNKNIDGLVDGYFFDGEVNFFTVESDELLFDALIQSGYEVEKSNVSRSIYVINDEGEEVRISDHKRPAVEQNGIYEEHEYENEIIVKENIIKLAQLKAKGINKLNKSEYLLG